LQGTFVLAFPVFYGFFHLIDLLLLISQLITYI